MLGSVGLRKPSGRPMAPYSSPCEGTDNGSRGVNTDETKQQG